MYGIFRECVVILQQYGGGGFYLLLYLTALGFLFVRERRRHIRIVLVVVPLILLACFLIPVTRIVFVAAFDEGDTYSLADPDGHDHRLRRGTGTFLL